MLPGSPFRGFALSCLLFVSIIAASPATPGRQAPTVPAGTRDSFYCPMHPDFRSDKQGKCPRCGMMLRAGLPDVTPLPPVETATKEGPLEIPDIAVIDQNGKKLNFYSDLVKGKTVAINFVFTTCTTICPPLTATMSRIQQRLGEVAGHGIQLISITVDPATDVPARLKGFADKFGAKPGWTFVTGSNRDIDRLLTALGAYVSDPAGHSPIVLIGNEPARYWIRSYGLAAPSALTDLIIQAAAKSSSPNPTAASSAHKQ